MWIITPDGKDIINTDNCSKIQVRMKRDSELNPKGYQVQADCFDGIAYVTVPGSYEYAQRELSRIVGALESGDKICRIVPMSDEHFDPEKPEGGVK